MTEKMMEKACMKAYLKLTALFTAMAMAMYGVIIWMTKKSDSVEDLE